MRDCGTFVLISANLSRKNTFWALDKEKQNFLTLQVKLKDKFWRQSAVKICPKEWIGGLKFEI